MTDYQKIDQITEDVLPEFPHESRGGYIEDEVDNWLRQHMLEVRQIIQYQNLGADLLVAAEAEKAVLNQEKLDLQAAVDEANARVAFLENNPVVVTHEAEAVTLVAPVAPTPVAVAPSYESEGQQASVLLQNAMKLANDHVDAAKAEAEKIVVDAHASLVDLKADIEKYEGYKFATFHALTDFLSNELERLQNEAVFANLKDSEEAAPEEEAVPEELDETPVEELSDAEVEGLEEFEADLTMEEAKSQTFDDED